MVNRKNTDNVMHQSAERSDTITLTDYRDAVAKSYHQQLLELAKILIKEEQRHRHSLAVIVAHMACEMAVERVMAKVTDGREISEDQLMDGYNIGSPRNREAYTKLTGDNIQRKCFWPKFKESTKRRNCIVHKRHIATREEARESLKAVEDLIGYLKTKHDMPWN